MDNTREKLIELLVRTECNGSEEQGCCPSRKYGFCGELNKLSYCTIQHITVFRDAKQRMYHGWNH